MRDDAPSGLLTRPETDPEVGRPLPPTLRRAPLPATSSRPGERRWRRWTIAAGLSAVVIAGVVRVWMPEPPAVDVGSVVRGPLEVTVDEDGRTRLKDRFTVSAPLAGTLVRPTVRVGDRVERGAVVARVVPVAAPLLDPRARAEAEARLAVARGTLRRAGTEVERARAARDFARREAARQRALLAAGATAQQQVDQGALAEQMRGEELAGAELAREVAAAEVELARAALRRLEQPEARDGLEVRSPVAGRVLRVHQESEAVVQSGTPLAEIGDPASLEVVVDVLTADAVDIRPGAAVRIEQWGGSTALTGHVHRVEPSGFTRISALGVEEQRVNVLIDLDGGAGETGLGDGYRVEARITVWAADRVLQVPAGAVFRQDGRWAVYRIEGGRGRLRPVELGRRNPARAQVLGGLEEGDRVVVYPADDIGDGMRVEER